MLVLSVACTNSPAVEPDAGPAPVVIEGARIWDGTGSPAVNDGILVMRGDRIEAVGPRGSVPLPEGATVIDGTGKTVIPGLVNGHGHLGLTRGLVQSKDNYSRESILQNLIQYARYGVTTSVSLGLDSEPIFEVRGPAKPEETPRATILTAGRGFTGVDGYPSMLAGLDGIPVEVDNVEQIRAHIDELARQQVDFVKVWVDDHFGRYPKIRPDLYRMIIEEAHKQNLRVVAHLFYLADAKGLVEAGIDGLVHSVRDRDVDDALIQMMKEKGTFYVSTLMRDESTFFYTEPPAWLDDPFFTRHADPDLTARLKDPAYGKRVRSDPDFAKLAPAYEQGKRNLKKLFDAGVKIAFGTDTGPPGRHHGFFEHLELEQMVEAGLTPEQVLHIATAGTAQALGIDTDTGSLQSGKRADVLLLDADPLESILNTRKISRVWVGGREVD
jgi:imidazolonepropionase-like amidohydrolase